MTASAAASAALAAAAIWTLTTLAINQIAMRLSGLGNLDTHYLRITAAAAILIFVFVFLILLV